MPAGNHDSRLKAVLSYYDSVVSVTPEGDSHVSDETLEGLGTDDLSSSSLLYSLFGSLVRVAASPLPPPATIPEPCSGSSGDTDSTEISRTRPGTASTASKRRMDAVGNASDDDSCSSNGTAPTKRRRLVATEPTQSTPQVGDGTRGEHKEQRQSSAGIEKPPKKFKLTDFAPDPGYFLAGAIAGGVSRTATAPLDRLKVYLLVNTSSSSETAVAAIKQGRPAAAVKNALRPISDAVKDLSRNGGLRSFFAGKSSSPLPSIAHRFLCFCSRARCDILCVWTNGFCVLTFRTNIRQRLERDQDYARDSHQVRIIRGR